MTDIKHDPEYELVPERLILKGRQCGKCGMKFDYGTGYGFYCSTYNCPMGFGAAGGQWVTAGMSEGGVG